MAIVYNFVFIVDNKCCKPKLHTPQKKKKSNSNINGKYAKLK